MLIFILILKLEGICWIYYFKILNLSGNIIKFKLFIEIGFSSNVFFNLH